MGREEQFNLPLEPRLTNEELNTLPGLLSHEGLEAKIREPEEDSSTEISVTANGVTSVFTVDLFDLTLKFNEEKSYDLFEGSDDHTDISSRPVESAENIHEDRKEMIREMLHTLADPTLIDTE